MKCRIILLATAVSLLSFSATAEPITLSEVDLDRITAGNLALPNGNTVLDGFDNPAPGEFHPSFGRSAAAADATAGIPASGDPAAGFSGTNEGPWSAHFVSQAVGCTEGPCI